MTDGFEAIFNVEMLPRNVWEAVVMPDDSMGHCRIPGFPSFGSDTPGCQVEIIEADQERLLRGEKKDMPCAGTEITVRIEPANAAGWPTRITLSQYGFGNVLEGMRDAFETHWRQIVADFRLHLERGVTAPPTKWGVDFGAAAKHTPLGLQLTSVASAGFAERCGMCPGDMLLTIAGVRIHDTAQLWTVLALTTADAETTATWARDREVLTAAATF